MKNNWRTAAEFIAAISIVLSLLFVGYELRLNRSIATNESYAQAMEMTTTMREYASQYPSILSRGCLGEELSEDEAFVFSNYVRAIDRIGFFRYLRATEGLTRVSGYVHARAIAHNRAAFPGFDKKWLEFGQFGAGSQGWNQAVEDQFSEIGKQNNSSPSNATLCGFLN